MVNPYDDVPAELERRLIRAGGDPAEHAKVRQEIREAGFPGLADELDRIAAQHGE
ncbi:hypothetical protein ABZY58_11265 [Micromonospora tulbaghiae]|uniref:hypothetical protein n=1 Tax=Micromonospora tulbaghiae TaxID=479978 RepID=UPI0033BA5C10